MMYHYKKAKPFDYDFTCNEQFYKIQLPLYSIQNKVVFYEIHLKDLINHKMYITQVRFKQLKYIHQRFILCHLAVPDFPKTHFWMKTNKNQELIEQRRNILEKYLNIVVNHPFLRGHHQVKHFVKLFKRLDNKIQQFSLQKRAETSPNKSRSLSNVISKYKQMLNVGELRKAKQQT